jgi:hypothetical protein
MPHRSTFARRRDATCVCRCLCRAMALGTRGAAGMVSSTSERLSENFLGSVAASTGDRHLPGGAWMMTRGRGQADSTCADSASHSKIVAGPSRRPAGEGGGAGRQGQRRTQSTDLAQRRLRCPPSVALDDARARAADRRGAGVPGTPVCSARQQRVGRATRGWRIEAAPTIASRSCARAACDSRAASIRGCRPSRQPTRVARAYP